MAEFALRIQEIQGGQRLDSTLKIRNHLIRAGQTLISIAPSLTVPPQRAGARSGFTTDCI
eukprot:2756669-Prymnesium_polylepis.2